MIFGSRKKKQQQSTFSQRVNQFWQWFPTVADRAHRELNDGNVEGIVSVFPEQMETLLPGLSWVFGPGEQDGHSFTVTGEGQIAKQLLAAYWLDHAVKLPGWTFHASRQPSPRDRNQDAAINVGGHSLDLNAVEVSLNVDEEAESVDLRVWHPLFGDLDEDGRWQILFLFLDEVLGEFGTQTWIGEIEFGEGADPILLIDLPETLAAIQTQHGWEKRSPLDTFTGYGTEDPGSGFPRSDVIAGFSIYPELAFDYAHNKGAIDENPLDGTGAEFAFLMIDKSFLPEDDPIGGREKIEQALSAQFQDSARFIGGATGIAASYLDLLIFDGDRTREIISAALKSLDIDSGCRLEPFTR